MKNIFITLLVFISCNATTGQNTLYKECEKRLESVLIKDDLIKPTSSDKKEQQFYSHIKGIYKRLLPDNSGLASKEIKYDFSSKSLEKIFTTAYIGKLSTSNIGGISSYELPKPLNYLPIYMIDKQADNFKLNINSSNALAQSLDVEFDGKISILESKASSALKNSIKSQTNFDVFYGQFENRIGKLFWDLTNENSPVIGNEWNPFFELWNLYFNQESFRQNYKDYRVLKTFYGMIISTSNRQSMSNSTEIESMIKLNYNYMGLAGINSKYDFEWSKSRSGGSEQQNYSVYMINEPGFPIRSIELPSIEKIRTAWESRRDNICSIINPTQESFITLNGNVFDLTLLFGPIPSDFVHKTLGYSSDNLVESITAIQYEPTDESVNSKGTAQYSMKVKLNKDELSKLQSKTNRNGEIEKVISIVFGLGDIKNVNERLAYTYNALIKIDLKPYPEMSSYRLSDITSRNVGSRKEYQIPINYKVVQGNEGLSLTNVMISNCSFLNNDLNKKVSFNLSNQNSKLNDSGFSDRITIIADENTITNESLIQDLEITFSYKEGKTNYSKKNIVTVVFPEITNGNLEQIATKTISESLNTLYLKELDLNKLDSTYTININKKLFEIKDIVSIYRSNPESKAILIDNETIETKEALSQISDELVKRDVISPTLTNKKGIFIKNTFKTNQ
ncbi:hypothetical protein [Flavobacterium sp.]|uniref:hypothetical protein n=1 Tax=Flavobacterium sp. TaxID=239 RepID=UPI0031DDB12F